MYGGSTSIPPSVGKLKMSGLADQLATVSKARLFRRADIISQEDMLKIEESIKIQLDIH